MLNRLPYYQPKMYGRVWVLAWPMILSNITVPLLGLVDTAVIGHLSGPHYLAGVAIAASIFSVLFWAFGFLRMSTTGLVAKAYGEQDTQQLAQILGQSLLIAFALGAALLLLQTPLINAGLWLLNPESHVREQAVIYAETRIYSAPATLANYALLGWFLGMQNSRIPLLLLITANLINIGLDILLVVIFDWKVAGAAWATLAADYGSLALGGYLAWKKLLQQDSLVVMAELLNIQRYKQLFIANRSLFIRTLLLLFVFSFFSRQGAQMGTEILAANAVLLNFLMLTSHGLDGFAHAIEAISGRYMGAKDQQSLKAACWSAGVLSVVTAVILSLFFWLLGPLIIDQLTDISAIINIANTYLPWLIVMPIVGVWGYLFDGIFIGMQRYRDMQNCMIFCVFCVYLPLWWVFQDLGNHGLWLALIIFMGSRGISQITLLSWGKRKA